MMKCGGQVCGSSARNVVVVSVKSTLGETVAQPRPAAVCRSASPEPGPAGGRIPRCSQTPLEVAAWQVGIAEVAGSARRGSASVRRFFRLAVIRGVAAGAGRKPARLRARAGCRGVPGHERPADRQCVITYGIIGAAFTLSMVCPVAKAWSGKLLTRCQPSRAASQLGCR